MEYRNLQAPPYFISFYKYTRKVAIGIIFSFSLRPWIKVSTHHARLVWLPISIRQILLIYFMHTKN